MRFVVGLFFLFVAWDAHPATREDSFKVALAQCSAVYGALYYEASERKASNVSMYEEILGHFIELSLLANGSDEHGKIVSFTAEKIAASPAMFAATAAECSLLYGTTVVPLIAQRQADRKRRERQQELVL